ncbi:uncharacterized protein LOC143290085 [Babylonia areolata]|uniref:uncharacterized protein LOC143290085 n=1 Tax=Babylonia areolata TaxID=304850 RepID=UPI003FD699FF
MTTPYSLYNDHSTTTTTTTNTTHSDGLGGAGREGGGGQGVLEAIPFVQDGVDGGWFGRLGTSAILLLGTFGNVMVIVILRRLRAGWSAMNVYLTSLAVSDTAMVYTGTLPIWTRKMFRYDLYASHVAVCKVGIWVMNSSAALSAWLIVALTVQRAASVALPHRVNLICTRRKSLVVIALITLICFSLYAHTLYGYQLVTVGGDGVRCTFGYPGYQQFWVAVWVRLDMFIYSLLPCAFLLCSNTVLVWKLTVAARHARQQLSAGVGDSDNNRRKKTSSTTLTIIIVSGAFIVVTIPLMAYNSFFQDFASEDEESRAFHYFLYEFFFVVGLSNFGINFYLYCLTGSKFRQEFQNIMLGCCRRSLSGSELSGSELSRVGSKQNVDNQDDF